MLLLIGLGLTPPASLSLESWEVLQSADKIYLETYTNIGITVEDFAAFLHKPVIAAPRSVVESDLLLREASQQTIALCVIGDVFTATTHSVLYLDCLKEDIVVRVFQNVGIMNAVGIIGLELYKFGQTVSLVYPSQQYAPTSFLQKIAANRAAGLHTLCLMDIKADEGRFMTIPEAIDLLEDHMPPLAIGVARLGTENHVFAGSAHDLKQHAWPAQPHSLILPGNLNVVENEFLEYWQR
jgi:diphthine synthase